jgi:hypothetical protein
MQVVQVKVATTLYMGAVSCCFRGERAWLRATNTIRVAGQVVLAIALLPQTDPLNQSACYDILRWHPLIKASSAPDQHASVSTNWPHHIAPGPVRQDTRVIGREARRI